MSDRSQILKSLKNIDGVLFIEPSRNLYMQDEVHDEARKQIETRGLPRDHPYIGWHAQANAFTSKGELRGAQRIYFGGGDLQAIRDGLASLTTYGFIVLGGRNSGEPFVVRRDAVPADLEPSAAEDWKTRLEVLGDELLAPLREGEAEQLKALLRHKEMSKVYEPALRALRLRDLLDHEDLTVVLADERLADAGRELTPAVVLALRTRHPLAVQTVTHLASEGRAEAEMFSAWGGREAMETARELAIQRPHSFSRTYLDLVASAGEDVVEAGIALAEEQRSRKGPQSDRSAESTIVALLEWYGGHGIAYRESMLSDERYPLWMRVLLVNSFLRAPRDPQQVAALGTHDATRAVEPEQVERWLDTVDSVREAAGLAPSPGFDVTSTTWLNEVVEQREFMVARHGEGLRAALRDGDLSEPVAAVVLDLLYGAGQLGSETLEALLVNWKERWLVKPGTYTPAPPAILVLAVALAAAQHPQAIDLIETMRRDRHAWMRPHQVLLHGALGWGVEADTAAQDKLLELANSGKGEWGEALHSRVQIMSRLRQMSRVQAACELTTTIRQSPRYFPLECASLAIEFADGGVSALRAKRFESRSPRALRTAVRLASDESIPMVARRHFLHLAKETSVLDYPTERMHSVMPLDEVNSIRQQIAELDARLVE